MVESPILAARWAEMKAAKAEDERINGPFRNARAAEKARIDALGLPPDKAKEMLWAWVTEWVKNHPPAE